MGYCPECGTEWREGIERCKDCGSELVDEPAVAIPEQKPERHGWSRRFGSDHWSLPRRAALQRLRWLAEGLLALLAAFYLIDVITTEWSVLDAHGSESVAHVIVRALADLLPRFWVLFAALLLASVLAVIVEERRPLIVASIQYSVLALAVVLAISYGDYCARIDLEFLRRYTAGFVASTFLTLALLAGFLIIGLASRGYLKHRKEFSNDG
jgi:hypothetical protein